MLRRMLCTVGLGVGLMAVGGTKASAQVSIRIGGGPTPPPAEVVEVVPARPGPEWVWVKGHHKWEGGRYVWVHGEWRRPPRGMREYVPGHWDHDPQGNFWVEGYWR
jgi:hypothetical protein